MKKYEIRARQRETESLMECCNNNPRFAALDSAKKYGIVEALEAGILNAAINYATTNNVPKIWDSDDFMAVYNLIGYRVKINIDPKSSVNRQNPPLEPLIDRILDGAVEPGEIGKMNSQQLNPSANIHIVKELETRAQQKIKINYSTMYKCDKCGKSQTQMREIQTRSGDEGGTLFITCVNCNNVWRKYG